jgi:MFS transporter, DHA2 family, multidrug resistance protein
MASVANPATAPAATFQVPHKALLTVAVMLATMMQILDTTIANVAVPLMQTSLGATFDSVTWVLTSYIIASAVAIPVTGWLSDRVGSRNLFLFAVTGFIVASMLCGVAANLTSMVLFRMMQGMAAAFIGPLSQTVMLDINPPDKQAKAMAIWGMGIMVGPILGPIIGGWLTENYNWRWVFYVNLPVGLVALGLLWWLLPSRPVNRRSFDLFGFSMLGLALASLQLMLDRGAHADWFDSWEIRVEAMVALGAAWMFGVHMVTGRNPLFDRKLIINRNFLTALFFMIIVGMMMMAIMALMPPMLQRLFGYSVLDTGILLAPRGVGILISMAIAGQLIGRGFDPRILVAVGMMIAAASLWRMSGWAMMMDWHPFVIDGVIQGVGMGLIFIPLNGMAFATLPPQLRTDGASLMNLFRSLGGSVGISIMTTILGANIQTSHADMAGHVTDSALADMGLSGIERLAQYGQAGLSMVDGEINRQAAMIAYLDDFWILSIAVFAAIPLLLLLKRPARPPGAQLPMGE